jgi:hypothetical protein
MAWRGFSGNCHHSCTFRRGVPVTFGHQALLLRGHSMFPNLHFPPPFEAMRVAVPTSLEKTRFGIPPAGLT